MITEAVQTDLVLGSWVSPTATRGASGRCYWTRMAAPFCCSKNWENNSSIRRTTHGDAVIRTPAGRL